MDQSTFVNRFKQTQMVALAIVGGCVAFTLVMCILFLKAKQESVSYSANLNLIRYVIWGACIFNLFLSFILKNTILGQDTKVPGSMVQDIDKLSKKLSMVAFVTLALCEGIVLIGAVLTFLSKNIQDLILPVTIGMIGFIIHFPRYSDWENKLQNN